MVTNHITGYQALDEALKEFPTNIAKNTLAAALRKAAKPVLLAAQDNARRFKNPGIYTTGQLADSIRIGATLNKRQRRLNKKTKYNAYAYIGPTSPMGNHAHFKEFGTSKQPAEPFLRPAWDAHKAEFFTMFKIELKKSIEATRKRLARKALSARGLRSV